MVLLNKDKFILYCEILWDKFPTELIEIHFAILLLGILLTMYITQDKEKRQRICSLLFLLIYYSLVLCSALFLRGDSERYRYELIPFWSYDAFIHYDSQLLIQIYLNIFIFVPIGFLLGIIFNNNRVLKIFICGAVLSLIIEFCQLFLRKGVFEFDDVFHNTLGCYVGYLFLEFVLKLSSKI